MMNASTAQRVRLRRDADRPETAKARRALRRPVDAEGNRIRRASYGQHGEYGWDVDHHHPKSKGGSDQMSNLKPLHWEANIEKSDKIKKK